MARERRAVESIRAALLLAASAMLLPVYPSLAETDLGPVQLSGEGEVGGRIVSGDFASSKYEEYRQQRPGAFGNLWFLLDEDDPRYYLRGWSEDAGENDQFYRLEGGRYGLFRIDLQYDELPHVFSNNGRTLFTDMGGGVLTFPDATQAAIQAAAGNAAKSALLATALDGAEHVDLDLRIRRGEARFSYEPTPGLELVGGYRARDREGTEPRAMGFGSPGGTFVNVATPVDDRTHRADAELRLSGETWNAEVGYEGSFYDNDRGALIIDNPLRSTDDADDGSSRGRLSLWPDNMAHTGRVAGAWTLPTEFPARLAGSFSYGIRLQDERFLDHTINSAFVGEPALDLPDDSPDAKVQTRLANVRLTARPLPRLNLTARYRFYDYDNDTDSITFPGHVINDQNFAEEERFTVPNEYRRHNAGLDASYHLIDPATLKLGYEWERWDRSNDREVTQLDEHRAKAALDLRPAPWALVRTSYLLGVRRGSTYNTLAHLAHAVVEEDFTEAAPQSQFSELRKFDQADLVRNEVNLLAQFSPCESVSLALTGSYAFYDYHDSAFGLTDRELWSAGADVSYSPWSWISFYSYYTYENIWSRQRSRWRSRNFSPPIVVTDDPVNDWLSWSEDRVHNGGVGAQIALVPDRLDLDLGYTIQDATAETRAKGAPGTTSVASDGGNGVDWPDIEDVLQIVRAALRLHVHERLTLGAEYRYERFHLDNFKTDKLMPFMAASNVNGSGTVSPSLDTFLGDSIEDYHAHVIELSAILRF